MQEEIAHCAAGVRWLTYLHKQALAAYAARQDHITQHMQGVKLNGSALQHSDADSNQQTFVQQLAHHISSGQARQPCQGDISQTMSENISNACNARSPAHQNNFASKLPEIAHQQAATGPAADAQTCPAASGNVYHAQIHAWQAEAAQHATVEEWFHALVRAHFKGSLKASFALLLQLQSIVHYVSAFDWQSGQILLSSAT